MGIVAFECSPDIRDYSPALVTFYFLHWTEQCPPHTQKMDEPARTEELLNPEPNQNSQSRSSLTGLPSRNAKGPAQSTVELV